MCTSVQFGVHTQIFEKHRTDFTYLTGHDFNLTPMHKLYRENGNILFKYIYINNSTDTWLSSG